MSSTATCTRTSTHARHDHAHEPGGAARPVARSQAFGIGLVHGMGGSAGVGVLLLATIPDQAEAVAALVVLAARHRRLDGAALVGVRLRDHARARCSDGCSRSRPRWASLTLAFGGWYTLGAIGAVPYLL